MIVPIISGTILLALGQPVAGVITFVLVWAGIKAITK